MFQPGLRRKPDRRLVKIGKKSRQRALTPDGIFRNQPSQCGYGPSVGISAGRSSRTISASGTLCRCLLIAGLMDEVIDPELTSAISRLVADSATDAIEIHAIRPRTDGTPFSSRCISWCLARCPYPTLTGSVIASRCRLREHFGGTVVNIHIEPEEKAKGNDAITPSPLPPQVYGEPSPQHASRPCS
ncbi:hypothetical protein [Gluconacetobacter asukensis]|nr:hypothetical protein [Gluconacetobacter asukensis]